MSFLRSQEMKKEALIFGAVSAVGILAGFLLGKWTGLLAVGLCGGFCLLHFGTTGVRYRRIARLAGEINRVLHGETAIELERYSEGELGVLQSEIYKMTVRLREQRQTLLEDKVGLANAIADISHQIRTPLTSINLLVQFLSEPGISEERRETLCRELDELLRRIDWLITALLKISKLDAGTVHFQPETMALEDLLRRACAPLLVPMELRGQELCIRAEGNVTADPAWTCEAIGNIVKNCMEHTPVGGKIVLVAVDNPLYTEIVIADNGCGIDQEDLPHIFERFYKGKNSDDKSFGIGLALSRMILVGQNGTIKAENRSSGGAQFTLHFYKSIV